jgi:hypothetical protein
MPVRVCCPQFDPVVRSAVTDAVRHVILRWRPSFELWRLSVFRSQSGHGWDLAISGPRFRRVFTLTGPIDDMPGLVSAYVDALLATK